MFSRPARRRGRRRVVMASAVAVIGAAIAAPDRSADTDAASDHGPRIPLVVVSPYSTGGHGVHSYTDHVSILKFIERNWHLGPLTGRSRDNQPNPGTSGGNPYIPANSPAISDLFDMFDFGRKSEADNG